MDLCEASEELKQKYLARIPAAEVVDDIICPGMTVTSKSILAAKDLIFGQDDVVLASYPKSGTTWASEVLSAIAYEGDTEILTSIRMEERVPYVENHDVLLGDQTPLCRNGAVVSAKKKIWFTHLPLRHLPTSIREGKCKLVYVARNPKDQAVSYFHHHKMAKNFGLQTDLTWDEYFRLHCSGFLCRGSWFEHVLDYWNFSQHNPNAQFIFYEDMTADLMGAVTGIEEFIEVHLSVEQRSKIVKHCSFDSMKDNKMSNRSGVSVLDHNLGKFMRKGTVADWKNYFTVAQNEAFDELYKKKMEGSGLNFRFQ